MPYHDLLPPELFLDSLHLSEEGHRRLLSQFHRGSQCTAFFTAEDLARTHARQANPEEYRQRIKRITRIRNPFNPFNPLWNVREFCVRRDDWGV